MSAKDDVLALYVDNTFIYIELESMKVFRRCRHSFEKLGRSRGFSLLEALIGVVVVGLGFIGMAGLQLSALKDTQTSRNVSTATILARDMADRVRISGVAVAAFGFAAAAPTTTVNCVGATNFCSGADFFSTQYSNWRALVQTQLVGGNGIVCRDSTPNDGTPAAPSCSNATTDPLVVKVWWTEKDRTLGTQERYVMPLFARDGLMP